MTVQVGDVLKISACGRYFNQDICNVFYYLIAEWTGNLTLDDVAQKFAEDWGTVTAHFRVASSTIDKADVYVLGKSDQGSHTLSTPVAGTNANEGLPPFVSLSLRLFGENDLTRSGYKRIGGISEFYSGNGGVFTGAALAQATALRDFVQGIFFVSQEYSLAPVIVGRDLNGVPDPTKINPVNQVIIQPNLTTQNTRKVGRGS